ncbi:phenylalanine--tRNA ligase subunit beta [Candidatus Woesearchaeota archaeon]|nr:phenylalanine--tRNA ligase subunit beta [Candidatus Woesearchaeota archaeon]
MPTVTLNRKTFEKLVGKKLNDATLKDRISYLGTDLENVTADKIIVEIFPNRPDMLSEQGFARAFASFIGAKKGFREYSVKKSGQKVIVEQSAKNVRPYTACAIVKGIKFDDEKIREVIQIQEKLHVTYGRNRKKAAVGIYPFERITPPIRFLAMKPSEIIFRPLEYPTEINAMQMLSKHPAGREYGHLLNGMEKFPVFLDSTGKVLSVPPIINSHDIGKITEATTDVFIECSGFDYSVQATCLNIIVTALSDMGGTVYSVEIDMYGKNITSPDLSPSFMCLDLAYINKRLGLSLKESEAKELLSRMGHGYSNGKITIPPYRADILHQADIATDIAIAYGYENFPEKISKIHSIAGEDKFEVFKRRAAEILASIGMIECKTYHLSSKDSQSKLMDCDISPLPLANSLNEEYSVLLAWALPSLMDVLKKNKHNEYPQNIFSINTVFKKGNSETGVIENDRLACILCNEISDYTRIRQIFDYLLRMLGIEYTVNQTNHSSFIPGRVARISVKGKDVAYVGEISPQVISNWELSMPVAAFELNLTELFDVLN